MRLVTTPRCRSGRAEMSVARSRKRLLPSSHLMRAPSVPNGEWRCIRACVRPPCRPIVFVQGRGALEGDQGQCVSEPLSGTRMADKPGGCASHNNWKFALLLSRYSACYSDAPDSLVVVDVGSPRASSLETLLVCGSIAVGFSQWSRTCLRSLASGGCTSLRNHFEL